MATEGDLGSDSDDVYVTKVSSGHMEYLKSRILHYLSQTKDISAYIIHVRGQAAEMKVTFGSQQADQDQKCFSSLTSNKISVKNLPPSSDKEHLQMFFEYVKGQGGGPVKSITLDTENNFAIVEFEEEKAANIVMNKRPIKMLGVTVDVDIYIPYLDDEEMLKSIDLRGLPRALVKEISAIKLGDLKETLCIEENVFSQTTVPLEAAYSRQGKFSPELDEVDAGETLKIRPYCYALFARECKVIQETGIVLYDTSSPDIPVSQLIACRPVSKEHNTFSVKILNSGQEGCIAIGLVPDDYPPDNQPGWQKRSIGYHADDGGIFIEAGFHKRTAKEASVGDVMSFYVDISRNKGFFRKNGEQCDAFDIDPSQFGYYPCVSMHSIGEAVQLIETSFWEPDSMASRELEPPELQLVKYDDLWVGPAENMDMTKLYDIYCGWLTLYNPGRGFVGFCVAYGKKAAETHFGVLESQENWLYCFEREKVNRKDTVTVEWMVLESGRHYKLDKVKSLFKATTSSGFKKQHILPVSVRE